MATLRHNELGIPFLSQQQKAVWMVEARIDFIAQEKPVLVSFHIPEKPPGFNIVSEQAASQGYGFASIKEGQQRRGEWSIRKASGLQTLYFTLQLSPENTTLVQPKTPPTTTQAFWEEPQATAVKEVLNQAALKSSTPESLTRELIKLLQSPEPDQNAALLLNSDSAISLLTRILNDAGVPARIADGLVLEDARRRQHLKPFLQIYNGEHWLTLDPKTAKQGLPKNVLLWRQDGPSLLDVVGGEQSKVSFSMIKQTVPSLKMAQAQAQEKGLGFLSLNQLPIEEQSMFRMLLLLPLGALVVAFMQIIIGVKTSGTFMPVLIAVAFVQTSLVPGLLTFVGVVGAGLLMRSYLSSLNLLLVARIASLIILVIFLTTAISIVGSQLGFSTGMTVTFFPMIIMAWTIERMSILWEEEGPRDVLQQGFGSLLVAVLAYGVMTLPIAGHLSFNFPELHLVVLGLILLMGQYTGYKLSELYRFAPIKNYHV